MAAADFNGDGILDLLVEGGGSHFPAALALLLGNGDGTFAPPLYYSDFLDGAGISLAVGDFNGDGFPDVFMGGNGSSLPVLNVAGGGFQHGRSQNVSAFGAAPADFNNDGKLDVVLSAGLYENVYVILGNGDGTFQKAVKYDAPLTPYSVVVGDFNHDGNLDFATAMSLGSVIRVFLGNGDGTFSPGVDWIAGDEPASLVTADFNADRNLDFAVTDFHRSTLNLLRGVGDGTFNLPVIYNTGYRPTFVAASDFNQDGAIDLVVANGADDTLTVFLNDRGHVRISFEFEEPFTIGPDRNFHRQHFRLGR